MSKILQTFRLVRFPNLIIIAATMVLMRYGIIQPILVLYGLGLEFSLLDFIFLVLSVVLIGASGYMINDYFDVETDLINRPDKVIIGKYINSSVVYYSYFISNAIALILAFYVSYRVNNLALFTIFPITIGALWFYSTLYKSQLIVGNIIISIITAAVPFLVILYEVPLVYSKHHFYLISNGLSLKIIFVWVGMFSVFAFLLNVIRELVKDAEDMEGDNVSNRRTLPIVFGLDVTGKVITGLIILVIFMLSYIFFNYLRITPQEQFDWITFIYFLFLITIPLIVVAILVIKAKHKKYYSMASNITKLVMLTGIMYALIVRFKLL